MFMQFKFKDYLQIDFEFYRDTTAFAVSAYCFLYSLELAYFASSSVVVRKMGYSIYLLVPNQTAVVAQE